MKRMLECLLLLGMAVPGVSRAETPAPRPPMTSPAGLVEKSNTDRQRLKSELLELLSRTRKAFDANEVGVPEKLARTTGLRVVQWAELQSVGARIADVLDIDLPETAVRLRSETGPALVHYGVGTGSNEPGHVTGFILALRELSALACISKKDVDHAFGQVPVVVRPLAKPMDAAPPDAPQWEAFSKLKSSSQAELTLRYTLSDETKPTAGCLDSLTITLGWI